MKVKYWLYDTKLQWEKMKLQLCGQYLQNQYGNHQPVYPAGTAIMWRHIDIFSSYPLLVPVLCFDQPIYFSFHFNNKSSPIQHDPSHWVWLLGSSSTQDKTQKTNRRLSMNSKLLCLLQLQTLRLLSAPKSMLHFPTISYRYKSLLELEQQ